MLLLYLRNLFLTQGLKDFFFYFPLEAVDISTCDDPFFELIFVSGMRCGLKFMFLPMVLLGSSSVC